MTRGVTPTSVPGLGDTLGRALDNALDPLPPPSHQSQSDACLDTEDVGGASELDEVGDMFWSTSSGRAGGADAAANTAAEPADADVGGTEGAAVIIENPMDAWGFALLPPPVKLPPRIRYAAPPKALTRDGPGLPRAVEDPAPAVTSDAPNDACSSGTEGAEAGYRRAGDARETTDGGVSGQGGEAGAGGGGRQGHDDAPVRTGAQSQAQRQRRAPHPHWDDEAAVAVITLASPRGGISRSHDAATTGSPWGSMSMGNRTANQGAITEMGTGTGGAGTGTRMRTGTGFERRRPVVVLGPPPSPSRLTTAKRGGGAFLAAARSSDYAAPLLYEVEALREGLAAANFDRDNLANGLRVETEKHFAEAGGLWLQNADLSKSLEEALLRVSQLEAESREFRRRHAEEEKARGDVTARLRDSDAQLAEERAHNGTAAAEAVARADDLTGQLETANAELAMLSSRFEVRDETAMAEEKFIGALRKENDELRKRMHSLMNDKGVKPMPIALISDARNQDAKTEEEEIAAGKPLPPRAPAGKLRLNLRDVTRVESLRCGIEEAGILEGLDCLMVKSYGDLRDVWRYYVSVGRVKRGADGEPRLSMLQFARFTIDIGVIRKHEAQQASGVLAGTGDGTSSTPGTASSGSETLVAETDKTRARRSTMEAKGADKSLLSGGITFAPNADNLLSTALAETNARSAAIAEVRSASERALVVSANGSDGTGDVSTSDPTAAQIRRSSASVGRSKGGYIALADADRLYAVVTLRQVECETTSVSNGGKERLAGRLPDDRMLDFEEFCQAVCRLAHLLRSGETTGHATRKELASLAGSSSKNDLFKHSSVNGGLALRSVGSAPGGIGVAGVGESYGAGPTPLELGRSLGSSSVSDLARSSNAPASPSPSGGRSSGLPHIMLSGCLAVGPSGPYERSTAVAGQGPFPVGPAVMQSGFLTFLERFLSDVVLRKARRKDDLKALAAEDAASKKRVPIWKRGFGGGRDGRDRL